MNADASDSKVREKADASGIQQASTVVKVDPGEYTFTVRARGDIR